MLPLMLWMRRWLCCYLCANESCQYIRYAQKRPSQWWITVLRRPPIIALLWTLMVRIWRWPCCYRFCQYNLPIRLLCITTTKSLVKSRTYNNTNRWRSVNAHAKNAAVTMFVSLLAIKAANTSVMQNNDQVTGEIPYMQDHKSLTVRWYSSYEWVSEPIVISFANNSCQYVRYV